MYGELLTLCDESGIFLRKDAIALGYTDRTLIRALRANVIRRMRHGAYVLAERWDPLDERQRHLLTARAVLRQARTDALLSHTTAAIAHGAPVWDVSMREVHVTRTDQLGGRRQAGVVQHRGRLMPSDVTEADSLPVTSPVRTALDLTTITGVERSLPVMDHFLHTGQATTQALRAGARAMNLWANTLATDLTITLSDGRRESIGESRSFYLFWRGGLPMPVPQVEICDAAGRMVSRVDFAWPELGVFLEFDGREKYGRLRREGEDVVDAVLREKRREELICRLTGWRCIRITWADLYRPEQTIAMIRSVLAGGPIYR